MPESRDYQWIKLQFHTIIAELCLFFLLVTGVRQVSIYLASFVKNDS